MVLSIYSGYILTTRELEGLSALLDLYNNEKLTEIKLKIQSGDISHEKVKGLLKQHGLKQVADDLKGSIEKGIYFNVFYMWAKDSDHVTF